MSLEIKWKCDECKKDFITTHQAVECGYCKSKNIVRAIERRNQVI